MIQLHVVVDEVSLLCLVHVELMVEADDEVVIVIIEMSLDVYESEQIDSDMMVVYDLCIIVVSSEDQQVEEVEVLDELDAMQVALMIHDHDEHE